MTPSPHTCTDTSGVATVRFLLELNVKEFGSRVPTVANCATAMCSVEEEGEEEGMLGGRDTTADVSFTASSNTLPLNFSAGRTSVAISRYSNERDSPSREVVVLFASCSRVCRRSTLEYPSPTASHSRARSGFSTWLAVRTIFCSRQ